MNKRKFMKALRKENKEKLVAFLRKKGLEGTDTDVRNWHKAMEENRKKLIDYLAPEHKRNLAMLKEDEPPIDLGDNYNVNCTIVCRRKR